jgi:hypothetical protein
MPARKPPDPNARPQIERFREAARELGCDDNEEAFWDKVVRVARHTSSAQTIRDQGIPRTSNNDQENIPWWRGYHAYSDGKDVSDNPFADEESPEHEGWV